MFKRIGSPAGIEVVAFDDKTAIDVNCKHCGCVAGRKNNSFVRFAGSTVVVVSPEMFMCPKCGAKNECSKE